MKNISAIGVYNSPYDETHFVVTVEVDGKEYVVCDWHMCGVVSYIVESLGIESAVNEEQLYYDDYFKERLELYKGRR